MNLELKSNYHPSAAPHSDSQFRKAMSPSCANSTGTESTTHSEHGKLCQTRIWYIQSSPAHHIAPIASTRMLQAYQKAEDCYLLEFQTTSYPRLPPWGHRDQPLHANSLAGLAHILPSQTPTLVDSDRSLWPELHIQRYRPIVLSPPCSFEDEQCHRFRHGISSSEDEIQYTQGACSGLYLPKPPGSQLSFLVRRLSSIRSPSQCRSILQPHRRTRWQL